MKIKIKYTELGRSVVSNDLCCCDAHSPDGCLRNIQNSSNLPLSLLRLFLSKIWIALLLLPYSFTAQALSATTAKTIEGTNPYLVVTSNGKKLTNLTELMGFSMPKRDGSGGREWIDASMAEDALTIPTGMRYSDVTALIAADSVAFPLADMAGLTVGDDDGDALVGATITGDMVATWYNGGTMVPASNLGDTFDPCGGPYKLKFEVPTEVSANTVYGAPNTYPYGTSPGITYTFVSSDIKICNLRPLDMTVYTTDALAYPGGYNPARWQPNKGFMTSVGFPKTGFEGAIFSVIGSGNDQSKYRCRTDSPAKVSLSGAASATLGANCTVTYDAIDRAAFTANDATPIITMDYNSGTAGAESWASIGTYSIPAPALWAIGKGRQLYGNTTNLTTSTVFAALNACLLPGDPLTTQAQGAGTTAADQLWRKQKMFTRAELTNSPHANTAEGSLSQVSTNYYSRDTGTFMGEWGYIYSYPSSGWSASRYYWTAEAWSADGQFYVVANGGVNVSNPSGSNNVVAICRD